LGFQLEAKRKPIAGIAVSCNKIKYPLEGLNNDGGFLYVDEPCSFYPYTIETDVRSSTQTSSIIQVSLKEVTSGLVVEIGRLTVFTGSSIESEIRGDLIAGRDFRASISINGQDFAKKLDYLLFMYLKAFRLRRDNPNLPPTVEGITFLFKERKKTFPWLKLAPLRFRKASH
jgi:hypothetical protein